MQIELKTPISDADIRLLKVGDSVSLSGVLITGRDAAHKWIVDNFIHPTAEPSAEDKEIFAAIKPILDGGLIYHCGPVVAGLETKNINLLRLDPQPVFAKNLTRRMSCDYSTLRGLSAKAGWQVKHFRLARNYRLSIFMRLVAQPR